ncbi:MAG: sigma-70 family RNA polymerase sigma factor [Gemmatimonadetes bacterium]|nr:sigma-70 family RNA polymerase sigma factor [Gemmatimonadota bacterium]
MFREVNQYRERLERWPVQARDALQEVLERRTWMGLPHPSTEPVLYAAWTILLLSPLLGLVGVHNPFLLGPGRESIGDVTFFSACGSIGTEAHITGAKMTRTHGAEPIEDRARDIEVATRIAAGDYVALAELYERHKDAIFTVAYRLLDREAAADVVQDVFLLVSERAGSFRGDAPLGAWIRRIAVNLALRQLRRERWLLRFRIRWIPPKPVGPALTEAIDLDRAIAQLPESLRAPFVLHVIEGYSHAETSELLGTSEAACRQRVHRARARLASVLADQADPR